MKKILFTLAFLHIMTLSFCATKTITKNYNFDSVKSIDAGSIYDIQIIKGNEKGVKIICDQAYEEYLEVKYHMGELSLAMKPNMKMIKGNNAGIKVYLQMPTIEDIDLSGAAKIKTIGNFKTKELDIELSGATTIEGLDISGQELSIDCSGASKLKISGDFSQIDVEASGASSITMVSNSKELDIEISGASNMTVTGNHTYTEASCSGASNLQLEGSTDYIKAATSGASSIKAQHYKAKNGYAELSGASNTKVLCTGELKILVGKASKLTYYGNPNIINMDKNSNIIKGDD